MKKLFNLALAIVASVGIAVALSACEGLTKEYALVTDVGDIDDESFNQAAWEAVKDYAEANDKSYAYYRPTEDSTDARVAAIEQAVAKGAKIVVCPGYLFEVAIYNVQDLYPDVNFVLLDGEPHTPDYETYKTSDNVANMLYKEEIAGYLAGYAAVKDGFTKLGFCGGMAVPAVMRYGYGYIQGIDDAAAADTKNVELNYYYANAFQATDAATALMKSWYADGTEVVFGCGGKVYQSVVEGVKSQEGSKWIGVDVDQYKGLEDAEAKASIITSAMKGLRESVTTALELYNAGTFATVSGQTWNLGLETQIADAEARDYVGLPTETASWGFETFTLSAYNTLLNSIKDGVLVVSSDIAAMPVTTNTTVNVIA